MCGNTQRDKVRNEDMLERERLLPRKLTGLLDCWIAKGRVEMIAKEVDDERQRDSGRN